MRDMDRVQRGHNNIQAERYTYRTEDVIPLKQTVKRLMNYEFAVQQQISTLRVRDMKIVPPDNSDVNDTIRRQ